MIWLILLLDILFLSALSAVIYAGLPDQLGGVKMSLFVMGGLLWTLALLARILPLQLLQLGTIWVLEGGTIPGDLSAYTGDWRVLIWGPILAGVFEEGMRYIYFSRSNKAAIDRRYGPIVFGLGWGLGEVIVLFSLGILTNLGDTTNLRDYTLIQILPGLVERISAISLHVAMSILVFYAIYDDRKIGLILAVFLHFFVDFLIVLWPIFFPNLSDEAYIISLEATFLVLCAVLLAFSLTWFTKYGEKQASTAYALSRVQ